MNIRLYGYGCIGRATGRLLTEAGHTVQILDPAYIDASIRKWAVESTTPDAVVICVPGPEKNGRIDMSIVEGIIAEQLDVPIFVRTTAPVGWCRRQNRPNLVYWPSFARERYAYDDEMDENFRATRTIGVSGERAEGLSQPPVLIPMEVAIVPYEMAELAKLATNAFLAMSVSFANEMTHLCAEDSKMAGGAGMWHYVSAILRRDSRIGENAYLDANSRGWGGKCLPKDLHELINGYEPLPGGASVLRETDLVNEAVKGVRVVGQVDPLWGMFASMPSPQAPWP